MITIPGKIPITIRPLFWLMALFIAVLYTKSLGGIVSAVIVITFSVLFHEFGHALTAIIFSQKTRIELAVFGGFTYREGRKLKLWEEFLVVFNGPLFGLILGVGAYLFWQEVQPQNATVAFAVKFAALVNIFWTVINLVPVLPLDGGHLLSIVLEAIFGVKGIRWAIISGIVISLAISLLFFVLGYFLAGALFLIFTFESVRSLRYYKLYSENDRDEGLQNLLKEADHDFKRGDEIAALSKLEEVRTRAKKGLVFSIASVEMAEILKHQNRFEEAYQALAPLEKSLSTDERVLLHEIAFRAGHMDKVAALSKEVYQRSPTYKSALLNATAFAQLKKEEPAIGWLNCAIREGLPNIKEILARPEFAPFANKVLILEE